MTRRPLAARAARAAARLRVDLGIGPADAVCPFDLAERLDSNDLHCGIPSASVRACQVSMRLKNLKSRARKKISSTV